MIMMMMMMMMIELMEAQNQYCLTIAKVDVIIVQVYVT